MRKRLSVLFASLGIFLVGSTQITLSSSDWPMGSTTATIYWASYADSGMSISDSIDIGLPGSSVTYDFTKVPQFYQDTTTMDFLSSGSINFGSVHSGTEVAFVSDLNIDSLDTVLYSYSFLDSDGDHLIAKGITVFIDTNAFFHDSISGVWDTIDVVFTIDDTIVSKNNTFGSTDTEISKWKTSIGDFHHSENRHFTKEVDGSGTFVGPMGTAPVLRMKITEYKMNADSLAGDSAATIEMDTNYYFDFWSKGQTWKIARVEMQSNWTHILMIQVLNYTPVSIGKYEENNFTIFPNPNAGRFKIRMEKAVQESGIWVIYNAYGQQFASKAMGAGASEVELHVGGLANGIYYAVLKDEAGHNLAVKKFIRQN